MHACRRVLINNLNENALGFIKPSLYARLSLSASDERCEAWQLHAYGTVDQLQKDEIRVPIITRPDQVLVKVEAASLNPIDAAMIGGYGSTALNLLRKAETCTKSDVGEFPLVVGRDFAGTVLNVGQAVEDLRVGDPVWGVLSPHLQGALSNIVVAPSSTVAKKPLNVTTIEAASMLYTGMTAWSALQVTGGLAVLGAAGRKVLVIGGSGGVGTMAVQLLAAWGARVTATCSTTAIPLLHSLGLSSVIDYSHADFQQKLQDAGKFDVILDCAGLGTSGSSNYVTHLTDNPLAKYITLKSPLLSEMDNKGVVAGALSSVASLIQANLKPGLLPRLAPVRWAYFMPLPPALKEITDLTAKRKLKPCIDAIFDFKDVPKAFTKLQAGHTRGKIVIDASKREGARNASQTA